MLLVIVVAILADTAALVENATIRDCFGALLARSGHGYLDKEEAAFVARDGEGYRCVPWPTTNETWQTSFRGRMPDGTVAIVHSHPRRKPRPSSGDVQLARRLGLAVFVVTGDFVYAAMPDGSVATVVNQRRWAAR